MATALIIGAGIGGLAAAVALQRAGLEVKVFERSPVVREAGAGLSLWPNALRAVGELGLSDSLNAIALRGGGEIRTAQEEVLSRFSESDLAARYGDAVAYVHRAELLAMLYEAAGGPAVVRTASHCVGVEQDGDGVVARFESGRTERGDLLIGADGIHSVVRRTLFGPDPLRYAGYTAWRGVAPFPYGQIRHRSGELWGRGSRFGIVPLTGDRVYWFATDNAPRDRPDGADGRRQELLRIFRNYPDYVTALIEATPEEQILRNDIVDRRPIPRWTVGRITLLGDAAHPMTPNLGQGACQAVEDAVVLGRVLSEEGDAARALAWYEGQRLARANAVVEASWQVGRVAQWAHPVACWLRTRLYRAMPAGAQYRMLDRAILDPDRG